ASLPTLRFYETQLLSSYAPKLSKKPEKNTACWHKDNDILCNCSLHSKPPPQIHWQLDGKTVAENTSTADLKVSSSVQKNEVTSSLIWTGSPDGDLSIICLGNNSLGTPRSFSHVLLSSQVSPILYLCLSFFLPKCNTLHFSLLKFILFVFAQFSNLSRSF
uniref:CD80-like immunoglobulin C2-set domain-containing protein n=1 Tax=Podarcis muralis TaxID=64176 RepID=A0A670IGY4_PODMU